MNETAVRTIEMEAAAVKGLANLLDESFERAIEQLANCKGRIVVSGIGKTAIIAQKIVATLNSTGTPAIFLHAADAIHGDLGIIQQEDIVIIVSKSGESSEIKVLVPLIKNFGNCLMAITGNTASYLAKKADFIFNTTVEQEACPNNLAPTTSTTAQMVMGDAVAVCLMEKRGFQMQDFARAARVLPFLLGDHHERVRAHARLTPVGCQCLGCFLGHQTVGDEVAQYVQQIDRVILVAKLRRGGSAIHRLGL